MTERSARRRGLAGSLRELLLPGTTDLRLPNPVKVSEFREVVRGLRLAGTRILDLGCGSGVHSALLAAAGAEVTAVDPEPENITYARRRNLPRTVRGQLTYLLGTLEELVLPAGSFDAVVSFGVLEHLEDPAGTVAAAARLLRPRGTLHLTADAMNHVDDETFLARFEDTYGVRRRWDATSVVGLVAGAGLAPYEVRYLLAGPLALAEVAHHMGSNAVRTPRYNRATLRELAHEEQRMHPLVGGQFVLVRAQRPPIDGAGGGSP